MAVSGISGSGITGTLGNGSSALQNTRRESETRRFEDLVRQLESSSGEQEGEPSLGVSSSLVSRSHRLNGDYTQGFAGAFSAESDKTAAPQGFAANARTSSGGKPTIDRTSELYEQSLELENYMVKMMLSSMRSTIQHTSLSGDDNSYARDMYEDMMYDNLAESLTKNAGFGLADQIYIELSGQA